MIKPVRLRPAGMSDAAFLLALRNDPLTLEMSTRSAPIPWEEHVKWLKEALADPHYRILVGVDRGRAVGQVRFDIQEGEAEISVIVDPGHRGQGWASALIAAGVCWIERERGPTRVLARIKEINRASQIAFSRCGFRKTDEKMEGGAATGYWHHESQTAPVSPGGDDESNDGD